MRVTINAPNAPNAARWRRRREGAGTQPIYRVAAHIYFTTALILTMTYFIMKFPAVVCGDRACSAGNVTMRASEGRK